MIQDNNNFKESAELPLFKYIINSDYNKTYSPEDCFNEEFKKNLEEIEKLN